jgi:thiosulfate/3-mercaptopyruvate sulfurtransferase
LIFQGLADNCPKIEIMNPLATVQKLLSLKYNQNLILIDARAGTDAKERYQANHLEGALFADLETELSQKSSDPAQGGRHPLPPVEKFARFLGQLGIGPESHVVVYDDKSGALAAARLWWMLRAIGHEKVQVLDGGFQAAVAAGFPNSSKMETPLQGPPYPADSWKLPTVQIDEVEKVSQDPRFQVIDVREEERYQGKKEPIDLVAGHIPGAVNVPFSGNLDAAGFFRSPEELREKYAQTLGGRDAAHVIVHCGSGVTACHTLLAMNYAGMEIPKLYVGSWSEWSRKGKAIIKVDNT